VVTTVPLRAERRHERDSGVALLMAVMVLAMMGGLAIMAMDIVTLERDSAGYYNRARNSFYAAEAGAAHGRALLRQVESRAELPPFPAQAAPRPIGNSVDGGVLYDRESGNLPRYYGDPAFADPIRYVQDSGIIAEGMNLQLKGQKFTGTLWQINVAGESPDGSLSRLEVMAMKALTSGY
jgi:hypothetical protein